MGAMADTSSSSLLFSNLIVPLLFGVGVCNAVLGVVVLLSNRRQSSIKQAAHRTFALVAFSVAGWTITNALFRTAGSVEMARLWAQLAYVAALATAAAFLHFSWVYPRRRNISVLTATASWLLAIAIAVLAFAPGFVIRGIDLETRRIFTAPGVYLVALYMLGTSAWAFAIFLHNQSRLRGRSRAQARYVLYGSALTAAFGLFFNLLLPLAGDYRWVWLGPLCSLFFVGCSAYSIVAHHLFDVRLLIHRTLVYTLLLATLAGAFAAMERGLEHLLQSFLGHDGVFSPDLLAAVLVGFGVDPLKRGLHRIVAHRLFRHEPPDSDSWELEDEQHNELLQRSRGRAR